MSRPRRLLAFAVLIAVIAGSSSHALSECETLGSLPDSMRGPRPLGRVTFGPGEELHFSIQYGLITAGTAVMRIEPQIRIREGRPTYEIVTRARSTKMFSTFYPVNDRVVSYMDTLHLHSVRFQKHLREGKYRKDLRIVFDQENHLAHIDGKKVCEVEPHVQDVLSSLFYIRTLDLQVGQSIYVPNHDNGKNYPLEVKVHGRERVTVDAGTFDCLILEPVLMGESLFKQNGRLKVWVTDDELHLPVLLKSKVLVGAIACVLTEFKLGGEFTDGKPPAMVAVK